MVIVDPAMADDGRLYSIYTPDMVVCYAPTRVKGPHRKNQIIRGLLLIRYSILDPDPDSEDELREQ